MVIALAWRQGGYFPDTFMTAGAVVFGVLTFVLVVRPPYWRVSTGALTAIAALAGLAVWTAISSRWSSAPDVALEDFARTLLYVGMLGLGLMAAGSGRYSRSVVWGVVVLVAVIVGAGLISRLHPDWIDPRPAGSIIGEWRLSYPVGYWNTFGALGAMGVILGTGLAADPRSHPLLRALAAGAVVIVGTAAYLSFSRGAWLAFFVGLAALLALSAHRPALLMSAGICGLGLFVTVGRLASYDAITDGPVQGAGIIEEGAAYFPFLIAIAVTVALAQLMAAGWWLPAPARELLARRARVAAIVAGIVAFLGMAGFYLVRTSDVEGASASRLIQTSDWISRQWDEFMEPAAVGPGAEGAQRLTSARGTRSDLYRVAIDGFEGHPLWGDGSGGFEYRFAHDREVREKVRDAHSVYLETLGELGLPGVLLLLAFVGSVLYAAVRARVRGGSLPGAQAAAAGAAFVVWAVHAGVDWDWQMPALTGVALLLAGALFPEGRGRRRRKMAGDLR